MLKFYRVSGRSMEPTLRDGDYVVAATRLWRPREKKLVVAQHKKYGVLVKRVKRRTSKGYYLASDNTLGTTSETIGEIAENQLIGPVIFKVRRPAS